MILQGFEAFWALPREVKVAGYDKVCKAIEAYGKAKPGESEAQRLERERCCEFWTTLRQAIVEMWALTAMTGAPDTGDRDAVLALLLEGKIKVSVKVE